VQQQQQQWKAPARQLSALSSRTSLHTSDDGGGGWTQSDDDDGDDTHSSNSQSRSQTVAESDTEAALTDREQERHR
jgi:hypothetical protein